MQPNKSFRGQYEFLRNAHREGKLSPSEALKQAQELERKRYEVRENGVVDLATGLIFPTPKGELVERQLRDPDSGATGTFKIPSGIAIQLDHLQAIGDDESYDKLARRALGRREARPSREAGVQPRAPAGAPSGTARESGGLKSERQKVIDLETEKTLAAELAKTEAEQQTAIVNEGRRAGPTITLSNQLVQLASAPDANEIYGLARNDKNLMAIFTSLIGSGIQLGGGYSISVPELSEIYKTFKLTPEQQQRYQYALQKFREMAIKMSEFAKGSVSNYEQTLFSQASVNENDLPGTIRMKAEAMKARAEFEKERAALLRSKDASGNRRFKTTDDLYDSPEYENLVAKLDSKYEAILDQGGILEKAKQVPSAAPSGGRLSADEILNEAKGRGF